MAASKKMVVLVIACYLHHQGSHPDDGAASTSETSVNFYNNPEHCHLKSKFFP
jgi:hypothetical protein